MSEEERAEGNKEEVHNFSGVGRMTRSGRVFSPSNVQDATDAFAREKGKQRAIIGNPKVTLANVTQPIPIPEASSVPNEVEELMRIIKKTDYSIIDHLSHTPSKMSILSLLLYSEPHRNALMKLLKMRSCHMR